MDFHQKFLQEYQENSFRNSVVSFTRISLTIFQEFHQNFFPGISLYIASGIPLDIASTKFRQEFFPGIPSQFFPEIRSGIFQGVLPKIPCKIQGRIP